MIENFPSKEICELLDTSSRNVTNTINNYLDFGLNRALADDSRPGRPILFDARDMANIVTMVCTDKATNKKGILIQWKFNRLKESEREVWICDRQRLKG